MADLNDDMMATAEILNLQMQHRAALTCSVGRCCPDRKRAAEIHKSSTNREL